VRQVVGKIVRDLDATSFRAVRAGYRDLVVDLGTGDGKHVVSLARQRPDTLVVGVDAGPDAMRTTAQRAARKPAKGGVPNALFVWSAVEDLPPELTAITEVHVLMPWGSLLRALIAPDAAVLRAVAARCVAGATFLITVNLHAWRPPVPEVGDTAEPTPESAIASLAEPYARAGWHVESAHHLSAEQIEQLGTSWTKRLGSSRAELAVLCIRGTIDPDSATV
jgi:16S rRNA (adenine(1408)-N(1))-methyltransferase